MKTEATITALAPWFGSNRTLAPAVGEALRGCTWVGVVFAGGMTELRHVDARTILVNDLHGNIINLARVMADPTLGPQLYRRLRRLPFHPRALASAQARCLDAGGGEPVGGLFGAPEPRPWTDPLEQAVEYFTAVWMGRSAKAGTDDEFSGGLALRWNAGGGDSAVRFANATASIPAWRRVLRRCTFSEMDAFEFIDRAADAFERDASDDVHGLYLDPPFPDAGDPYRHKFTPTLHRRLAERVTALSPAMTVVCRFYDHPLVRELYPETRWEWRRMQGRDMANQAKPEVLLIRGGEVNPGACPQPGAT